MLHNEMQNCITKRECDQEIIKWDPKYETIKDRDVAEENFKQYSC